MNTENGKEVESMYAELIAQKGDVTPAAGHCYGWGVIPDPGSPGGICLLGYMPKW